MKILRRFMPLHLLVLAGFFPVRAELARIGMVHFTGNVESAGYLGGSLSSAIDDSLKKKFSYERIHEDQVKGALDELAKIGIFDPHTIPEKNNLLRIAVALNADILIYGSYGIIEKPGRRTGDKPPENEVTQISLRTYVYYVNENRTAELTELKPNLDASLFEAINTVAENVIVEFKKITVETESDDDEAETGSIQTAATLRMAWLPVAGEDKRNKAAAVLYENLANSIREQKHGVYIGGKSVKAFAQKVHWRAAMADAPQFLADAALTLKSDILFWPRLVTEGKVHYLAVSAYHAQLDKTLFTLREEISHDVAAAAEKMQKQILAKLRELSFKVTAQIAGLKGSGLVLDFGGSSFSLNPGETVKDFGKIFSPGQSYSLSVKKHPKEPRQFCHVRNGKGTVPLKNMEILITCITETVPLIVKLTEFYGDEVTLSLDGKEELKMSALGEQRFQTRVEDLQAFALRVVRAPKQPDQACKVGDPAKLGDGQTIDVKVSCRKVPEHYVLGFLGYPAMGSFGGGADQLQINENFPVGQMSSYLAIAAAYQVKNILPYNLILGAQINFSWASASLPVQMFSGETSAEKVKTNMLRSDLVAYVAYPFPLPYHFELLPYAGFGMSYQSLWQSGGISLSSGFTPLVTVGTMVQYDYRPNLKLFFKTGPDVYFYSGGENLMIWTFSLGAGMRFL